MSEKAEKFQFLNPITDIGKGAGITPNFPLGAGNIDFRNFKKNIPHFEELAIDFGLVKAKGAIMKTTLNLFTTEKLRPKQNGPGLPTSSERAPAFDLPAPVADGGSFTPNTLTHLGTSMLGTKVFSNLSITGGNYQNNQQQTIGEYDDVRVDCVIFEINRENNLVLTDMQGRDNSVTEYISGKSWKINCKGKIFSTAQRATNDGGPSYPFTEVNNLRIALDSNKSLRVNSWFLGMVGIYNIVIQKKNFPQEEGGIESQKFEFDAIADAPIILKRPK